MVLLNDFSIYPFRKVYQTKSPISTLLSPDAWESEWGLKVSVFPNTDVEPRLPMCYALAEMTDTERWDHIWSEKRRTATGRLGALSVHDIIHRTVVGILRREIPHPAGKRVLEEGSGTGLVSLDLARKGAAVFVLDKSDKALALSEAAFKTAEIDHLATRASILDLPFDQDSFDITWSGGVIEHFKKDEQVKILREMLRVTRPEGRVIVIAPAAEARIYGKAKAYADSRKAWQPGYEVPIGSLRKIAEAAGADLIGEYRVGLLAELHFFKYYFDFFKPLRLAWAGLVEVLSFLLGPLNQRPGYLLVSVLKKR
jgi:SAM-dependent methyltransferase